LTIDPKDEFAWYNKGLSERFLGNFTMGLADFEKALLFTPQHTKDWNDTIRNIGLVTELIHLQREGVTR
jgi:hypothetical protein